MLDSNIIYSYIEARFVYLFRDNLILSRQFLSYCYETWPREEMLLIRRFEALCCGICGHDYWRRCALQYMGVVPLTWAIALRRPMMKNAWSLPPRSLYKVRSAKHLAVWLINISLSHCFSRIVVPCPGCNIICAHFVPYIGVRKGQDFIIWTLSESRVVVYLP